ncbi:hypothetical protein NCAS_0A03370 [Naumovozyma castellii]|uniref:t-SNARE coiled-coil homology domain-containing protein n=1 Tax=Naumovozyma castellii TaxID=27288 RepID=G0V605_NAUCA|nr:hypothetical protein NCAS_0A03370 [Naumovozyma castellii CBS 4309]CCC66895.1 hypothetical protein NCAS_0A03370 [Naumovozyma castellii CBS 4309]
MANLTPLFRQCVTIIQTEHPSFKEPSQKTASQFRLNDTFIKECHQLLKCLLEMKKLATSIESQYLNDDDLEMTEAEKDDFDTEYRLQFQKYIQKFQLLESYEIDRQKLVNENLLKKQSNVLLNLFHSSSDKDNVKRLDKKTLQSLHQTNNNFRLGVLQSLSLLIGIVSSKFTSMQEERLSLQRKFDALNLNFPLNHDQSTSASSPLPSMTNIPSSAISMTVSESGPVETTHEEVKNYEETMSILTQQQIQLLESEHEELLNDKNEQLKKIEMINKSILDIVSIQTELSSHLQIQSQNINTVLDNQDDIELNIKAGNKQLQRAQRSAGKTARLTTYLAIIFGILILFLDYIS